MCFVGFVVGRFLRVVWCMCNDLLFGLYLKMEYKIVIVIKCLLEG